MVDRQGPVVLMIRDGWGQNPDASMDAYNAIVQANTPVADSLVRDWPSTLIGTCGKQVGLPEGIMGNSEVGHQNIGAGRIVPQELQRLNDAIDRNEFATNPVLAEVFARGTGKNAVHLIGLVSDGCVHSDISHLFAVLDAAPEHTNMFVHVITDGRDCSPTAGLGFVKQVEEHIQGMSVKIASVMGRYWAMDRDHRWERIAVAFHAMTGRSTTHPRQDETPCVVTSRSSVDAVTAYYENPSEQSRVGDEFIVPTQIVDENDLPVGLVQDHDAVLFVNYRGDRPRELTRAFVLDDASWDDVPRGSFTRGPRINNLYFATMTNYESNLPVSGVAFDKPEPMKNILGDVLSQNGMKQFRCAETEKFPHVTFFFNDYREEPLDGEERLLVPSPTDVSTYDQKPEMSAEQVCKAVLDQLNSDHCPEVIIVNFANPDMVGHTGNLPSIIQAVETVDACSGRIIDRTLDLGGALIVTADHGNAEQTWNPETNSPDTAHTTYDVPLHVIGNRTKDESLRDGGILADIAPTMLQLLGIPKPSQMTGQSLIKD